MITSGMVSVGAVPVSGNVCTQLSIAALWEEPFQEVDLDGPSFAHTTHVFQEIVSADMERGELGGDLTWAARVGYFRRGVNAVPWHHNHSNRSHAPSVSWSLAYGRAGSTRGAAGSVLSSHFDNDGVLLPALSPDTGERTELIAIMASCGEILRIINAGDVHKTPDNTGERALFVGTLVLANS